MRSNNTAGGIELYELSGAQTEMAARYVRNHAGRNGVQNQRENANISESSPHSIVLPAVKVLTIAFIAVGTLIAMVFSKITFISITGNMYYCILSRDDGIKDCKGNNRPDVIFVQLVLVLLIPDVICLFRCFVWGVVGKTTKSFPWPDLKAVVLGVVTSVLEVVVLCGFVFGVACKLPPPLVVLVLNGISWFVIARHLFRDVLCANRRRDQAARRDYHIIGGSDEDISIDGSEASADSAVITGGRMSWFGRRVTPMVEFVALVIQVAGIVALCILLATGSRYNDKHFLSVVILLPITLVLLSVLWSGWLQEKLVHSTDRREIVSDQVQTARLKAGMINSFIRICILPFVAYGMAKLVLDKGVAEHGILLDLNADSFKSWTNIDLNILLTQLFVSLAAYVFAWIACALQSWAFFVPALLSTPASILWYLASTETDHFFPFEGYSESLWGFKFYFYIAASLLWISQCLAYLYYIFQNTDVVLTNDANMFWMPRYNGVFLEQHLLLSRKTPITGSTGINFTDPLRVQEMARKSHIFICSTMYHENEIEMKQMLQSIYRVAEAASNGDLKYESHIFFDNAFSGEQQLNQYVMQLLGLLKDTVRVNPETVTKLSTPYGMQLQYELTGKMPFYIHLKDNRKVKNKKRWSQVMYMSYVLEYRIDKDKISKDNAFILTTDADIDFNIDSVAALLDILAQDSKVGAVCARTHPLGNGPVVWYQIFDYAIGHWFQKAAEHVLGCVLCCPGCFSAFRVSAIEQVLGTYSSSVESGFDFLTKDMGEDRWLCTLLIQAGWRLDYSAVSQDSTYCPESFEEFYKQRRRWIPSTIANLVEVIGNYSKITANNDSITIFFILYQFLLVFSSVIAPATVILIIVTGLTSINHGLDDVALIVVLSIISFLYGALCVYAKEATQLIAAKGLTLVFSIVMAVVIAGIVTDSISSAIVGDPLSLVPNGTVNGTFRFPVDVSTVYIGIFASTFILAGLLHFNEIFCLFHFIWYLLCLPSGYLFLFIYSVCNINNRSWGTREGSSSASSKDADGWFGYFIFKWHKLLDFFKACCWKRRPNLVPDDNPELIMKPPPKHVETEYLPFPEMNEKVEAWLQRIDCLMYAENFQREGYTELDFIASMKMADIEAIGVKKRGFQLKLEKEVKKLDTPELASHVPANVGKWLHTLKLFQYVKLFKSEGYCTDEDVENLKGLSRENLQRMGITRRAHLNQLMTGLRFLQYPTDIEIQTNKTRINMEKVPALDLKDLPDYKNEHEFWASLAANKLKPESANLGKVDELKVKLRNLRNFCLLILLLTNIMWIVFLYTLVFPQLTKYNLPDRAFSLLFLGIFSVIILIQFFSMLFHRLITLLHLLARTKLRREGRSINWFPTNAMLVSRRELE